MCDANLPPFWENSAFWLYSFVCLPFVLFVILYATRSPWRGSSTGRAVMALAGSLSAVLTFVLVLLAFPHIPPPIRDALRTAMLGTVGIAGWLMVKDLITKQRLSRKDPKRRSGDH